MKLRFLTLAAALAFSTGASAFTVFSDNFDSNNPTGLNVTPAGWSIANGGTVDVVGPANGWGWLCNGSGGSCVDLDGSTNSSGLLLSPDLALSAGVTYTASFDLAGNQRGGPDNTVSIVFQLGGTSTALTLASGAPWTTYSLSFTPGATGTYNLSFLDNSNNNVGAVLDNVKVEAVPEPETYAMLLAGLGILGLIARRRA